MYLFDTDILSRIAKKRRPEGLMTRLARTPQAAQFTTAVNTAEIYYGIRRLESRERGEGSGTAGADSVAGGAAGADSGASALLGVSAALLHFFEDQVFPRLTIFSFDAETAPIYGRLRSLLECKGRPRFEPDLQIASIALQHGLIVVTGNVRHFSGIPGLKVENWLE